MSGDINVDQGTFYFSIDDVVSPYMGVFFVAFCLSVVATPIMGVVARRFGIVDKPNYRKHHVQPTAYLGGVALFLAWIGGSFVGALGEPHTRALVPHLDHIQFPWAIFLGAAFVVTVGLLDDVFTVRARYKLCGQALAASCLVYEGIGTRVFHGALSSLGGWLGLDLVGSVPEVVIGLAGALLVTFFVLGACNATNLLDGMDGLASGVTVVAATGFGFIAVALAIGAYPGGVYSLALDPVRLIFCLALLGAVLGFLPYNFKPASIFMGDAGSMLLGYLCITLVLLLGERGDPLLVMAGLTVFALPILDTALAIVRRKSLGHRLSAPDNYHLHHMLTRAGLGVRRAVLVLYLLAIGFATLGGAMIFFRLRFVAAIFMVAFSFVAIMAFKIGQRQYHEDRQAQPKPAPQSARPEVVTLPKFTRAETGGGEAGRREPVEIEDPALTHAHL